MYDKIHHKKKKKFKRQNTDGIRTVERKLVKDLQWGNTMAQFQGCSKLKMSLDVPVCCCSVTQSCLSLCNPINCNRSDFPVFHHLPELAQTHVH